MAKPRWGVTLSGFFAHIVGRFRVLPATVDSAIDIPDRLARKTAVIVRKGDADVWLAFDCPCRAGHRVMLNLDRRAWPAWTINEPAPLTLVPSVDERTGYGRCHYIIKKGKIRWV